MLWPLTQRLGRSRPCRASTNPATGLGVYGFYGFRVMGFMGFMGFGFRDLGFKGLGFRGTFLLILKP